MNQLFFFTVCCLALRWILLLPLLIISLALAVSYAPYEIFLKEDGGSGTYYILPLNDVFCGEANSMHFSGIKIEGFLDTGDGLQGTIKSWLLREDDLKLYYYLNSPIWTNGSVTEVNNGPVLFNGYQIYTWKTSEISGYCCVTNHNDTDIDALLYIFQNDEDFQTGVAKNAILSDTITVQPNTSECFHKWGKAAPFYVEKSNSTISNIQRRTSLSHLYNYIDISQSNYTKIKNPSSPHHTYST